VSNALRHGGATADAPVRVSAVGSDGVVTLDVVDRGPGLSASGPVTQPSGLGVGTGRADRSAGLGLAIVRGFCEAMDVGLDFRDTSGGGLTVRLTLPVATR
jgi:two-component system sensor histidine kinase KdpD